LRYGIKEVAIGDRLSFDPAPDSVRHRVPRAVNIRVVSKEAPA
jgi:hypothetical protein